MMRPFSPTSRPSLASVLIDPDERTIGTNPRTFTVCAVEFMAIVGVGVEFWALLWIFG